MAGIQFYNTLTRQKEDFQPAKRGRVSLYCCGPTVYHTQHIGNMRGFLVHDFLKRALLYNGLKVKHVMNVTDVGHLTSDADEGEDKMEKGAKREGITVWEVAQCYLDEFLRDSARLNILGPTRVARVTDHIKEQVRMIKKLVRNGHAYDTPEAVYFDISKIEDYAALSGQKTEDKQVAAREDVEEGQDKKNPADFALWFKTVGKFQDHTMHWPSPWGEGFPGWHIECSALGDKYLGQPIDIHMGGKEHVGTHHTNERAQNIGAFGKPVVRFWVHNEWLVLAGGAKMAKSGGNSIVPQTVMDRGFDSLALRYLCLLTHYRKQIEFSWEALEAAGNALAKLQASFLDLPAGKQGNKKYEDKFLERINDDLDLPGALALAWQMIKDDEVPPEEKRASLARFDQVFGLGLAELRAEEIPQEIMDLGKKREEARSAKDFAKSDQLRDKISKKGYQVEDTPAGPKLTKI